MIDRNLLKDIGFIEGSGWDHEVWVYEGNFWVHYGREFNEFSGIGGGDIDGDTTDLKTFFTMFIDRVVDEAVEAATYNEEYD